MKPQYPVTLILLAACLPLILGACGHAQEKAAAEMERLNQVALADLKKGKTQEARKNLLEAVRVGKEAELTDQPIVARTHVTLGAVYANSKDEDRAAAHMSAAIERDPAIKLPRALATPSALKALRTARAGGGKGKGTKVAKAAKEPAKEPAKDLAAQEPAKPVEPAAPKVALAAPPPPPAPPLPPAEAPKPRPAAPPPEAAAPRITQPLVCRAPDEAPPENEVYFRCAVRADVKVARLSLHYRPAGSETFTEVRMARNKKGWYTGAVPAEATTGKSLQYFVAGHGGGKVESGSAESPNLIMVRDGAPPAGREDPVPGSGGSADDDEPTRSSSENEDPLAAVAAEREHERETKGSHRRAPGKVFLGFGLGSGYGWQPGGSLEFVKEKRVEAGQLSGGVVNLMPELGYQLSEDVAVALLGRLQFIPAEGSGDARSGSPVERAYAFLGRVTFMSGVSNWRGLYSLYAGAGSFRLRVPPTPGETVRSDTVRGGPFLAGGGLGFAYHASAHLAWTLELRVLAGLPTIAAVGDLSTGLEVAF